MCIWLEICLFLRYNIFGKGNRETKEIALILGHFCTGCLHILLNSADIGHVVDVKTLQFRFYAEWILKFCRLPNNAQQFSGNFRMLQLA
jgi:hypothetical protein